MKSKVFFVKAVNHKSAAAGISSIFRAVKAPEIFRGNDFVAVKTHFGEKNSVTHVPPQFIGEVGRLIKKNGGVPFLTETSTLYKGNRSDAVVHTMHAHAHGFTPEKTGMAVIMADGLKGDYEHEVVLPNGSKVMVAGMLKKISSIVAVSHPTGHIALGFGGAIKNLGMGLSSRKGKLVQHSSVKPSVAAAKCTGCGRCIKWCPVDAIEMTPKRKALIKDKKCIGCGECLTECRFDAVLYNWEMDNTRIQELTAEHAYGVVLGKKGLYVNYLLNFTKDCDCFGTKKKALIKNIGILASLDPVALDAATIDMVENEAKIPLEQLAHEGIDPRVQIRHAEKIGLGFSQYDIVSCK
ncbi:MAG: DUF362 domain-containing protein [Fibrobacteres bacterium]|nr:DUF362 domain-containing protein [Fibrobacterota bacterium]